MSISPVNVQGNPIQSQEVLDKRAKVDCKIHILVIVGKLFQGIAVVSSGVAIGFSFVMGPLILLALIPAIFFGCLGIYVVEDADMIFPGGSNEMSQTNSTPASAQRDPMYNGVRIPIGLKNEGNDCWLNAALQVVRNAPRLKDKIAARSSVCNQFFQSCEEEEKSRAMVLQSTNSRSVREYLCNVRPGVDLCGQDDPETFFEEVFSQEVGSPQTHSLHQFEQEINGRLTQNETGPIIQHGHAINIDVASNPGAPFNELFELVFDYEVNLVDRLRKFFHEVPQDLLIKVGRVRQIGEGAHMLGERTTAEFLMPEEITLPQGVCREVLGASPRFICSGFVVHIGGSGSGINSGHYVACVKKENQWFFCNDESVTPIDEDLAHNLSKNGYFYHYARSGI